VLVDFDLNLGQNVTTGPVAKHRVKNTGDAPIRLFAVVSGPKLRVVAVRPEKSKGTLRFRAGGLIFSGSATQQRAAFYWVKNEKGSRVD
jgi:hypothetical protein